MEDLNEGEIDAYLAFEERALVGEGSGGKHGFRRGPAGLMGPGSQMRC